ncbi:MAG: glycosyltransferase, partial [Fibrobacterota bacterium]
MIAIIAACSGLLVYIFLLGAAYAGLGKIKRKTASEPLRKNLFISVIVCARNEEKNIGVCLESLFNQDYGIENYEVIVVDDCSEDSTPEIVEKSKSLSETALKKVMTPENCPWKSRKKFALNTGIKAAQGEILAFTDADALVESGWLSSIASEYLSGTNINAVSGLTVLKERAEKGLAGKILSLEFIGLGLIGGGLISSGIPVLANGNNFSYRKEIFNKSGGFSGIENITSGDDDLLLQKFSKDPGFTAAFNCDKKGVVFTNGP